MYVKDSQTVCITGATGKLGRSFALGFAAAASNIVVTSRNEQRARELCDECLRSGAKRVYALSADLENDSASKIVTELANVKLLPTVLINNVRNLEFLCPSTDGAMSKRNWIGEFTLGVIAPYELTLSCAAASNSPLRSVINVASMYGVTAPNLRLYDEPTKQSPINYGVVKAALIHLTKELAVRLAPKVRVNAISYGGVEGRVDKVFKARYSQLCPSGRMLHENEVFGAARFLASDESSGMTGHNLVVDGGWTVW